LEFRTRLPDTLDRWDTVVSVDKDLTTQPPSMHDRFLPFRRFRKWSNTEVQGGYRDSREGGRLRDANKRVAA